MNFFPDIIVVEDDEGLNHLIQKTLQKKGFHTQGLLNGEDAVEWITNNKNDLILLDYELKDMTGKQVIETLAEKKCHIPFIIFTGQGNEKIAVEMMKLGAVDYLVKGNGFIDILPHVVKRAVNELTYNKKIKEAENALLGIEEREQRRIGQDLHDDLGQLLTGIAFKSRGLQRKLEKNLSVSAEDLSEITALVNQAKNQTRHLSRDLLLLGTEEGNLMSALKDLASNTERIYGILCDFKCDEIVTIYNKAAVTHVYRITQEAVTNAVKHGKPAHIEISLSRTNDKVELTVRDDGTGKAGTLTRKGGMGLQIMNYRANMIGASFNIQSDTHDGTVVKCVFSDKTK